MYALLLLLQETEVAPTPVKGVTAGLLAWILVGLLGLALAGLAFWIGRLYGRFQTRRDLAAEKERMFTIEKALQDFFEHERKKIEVERQALAQKVEFLAKKNDEYKQKAAGVGVMGMGKDRKAELLLQLMAENESLEERLFEQAMKFQSEREDHLKREMKHISVKRVMLSEILKEDRVQESIRAVLGDEDRLRRMALDRLPAPPGAMTEGTAGPTRDAQVEPAGPRPGGDTRDDGTGKRA